MQRLNVGCGDRPLPGWINVDSSPTVALAPLLAVLPSCRRGFAKAVIEGRVRFGSATRLPFPNASTDVLYSSHMMEHLDRREAARFLTEAFRVLRPAGAIRLALPDLRRKALAYVSDGCAETFIASLRMGADRPRTPMGWVLRSVSRADHLWMYDGASLAAHLNAAGFTGVRVLRPGETTIAGISDLDLREREAESVYVEARKPCRRLHPVSLPN